MTSERLNAYNVVWDTPSQDSAGSMPLGNGDIGLNVWCEPNGDLLFYISKSDNWSEVSRLLKIGLVRVCLTPSPLAAGAFQQTLKLADGEIEITMGTMGAPIVLRVWVDANAPLIHVEATGTEPFHMHAAVEIWRQEERELTGREAASAYGMHSGPHPIKESADHLLPGQNDRVIWWHRNPTSIWPLTMQHQGLGEFAENAHDPLLHRTFGALMHGPGLVNDGNSTITSVSARTSHQLQICAHTAQTESAEDWLNAIQEIAGNFAAANLETRRAEHRSWWQRFWQRSWIEISGFETAEIVTRGYMLQRFITACAGRGAFPIKFNGSLFTVDAREPEESYNADYRRWGGPYWFQNTRLSYWPMLASGDFEMMLPLFRMYREALPLAQERTRLYFGHDGAFFPETMYFWGAYANTNYGWDRTEKPVAFVENTYIRYYWSGVLELIVLMLDFYRHTADGAFLKETLLPFAEAGLQFYDEHYERDAAGKLFISPAQSLEMWQEADNPLPEIAGLRAVLGGLLELPDITEVQQHFWIRLRDTLPPIPFHEVNGQRLIAAAQRKTATASNVENPEMYAVFPYRQFGIGQPELDMAQATFHARGIRRNEGWHQDAIQAACLGLTSEAQEMVVERFSTPHTGSRFPAFWGPNYDWIPDQDHGCSAQIALQSMLIQNAGNQIYLLPAWPLEWDVEFKLHTAQQTQIEGSFRDGQLQSLKVCPEHRRKDIVLPLGMAP